MENLEENYSHIKGWAVDADPENEPTYPIKKYTGDDHGRLNYERHTQQQSDVEILHSTERPSITSVFGTTVPPAGFSGNIRRMAFKYSEGQWGHWLLLILADRINMVEGIIDDISKGHFPNIIAERGWTAEWKYNRTGLLKKLALGVAVTSAFIAYSKKSKRRSSLTS